MANQDFLLGDIRQDHLKNGSGPVIVQRDARFQVEIFACVSAGDDKLIALDARFA